MVARAFVFPGQGSQSVGMGLAWAQRSEAAKRTFAEADEVLGMHLTKLCWQGPEEDLQLTENTQPAILATSIAVYRAVADDLGPASVTAGHSLGEYSALVAAGSLAFADALRLVRERGRFMQEAVPVGAGAMAAILGLSASEVDRLADDASRQEDVCAVANYNAPVQTVIAGRAGAVQRAIDLAKERGAKRAILLPVSAPFHSPLMRPARLRLAPLLEETAFNDPRVPLVSNVDAETVTTGSGARRGLIRQVDSPVRWVESVETMAEEFDVAEFLEIGPGNVLGGLIRRIARHARQASLAEPEAWDRFSAAVTAEERVDE